MPDRLLPLLAVLAVLAVAGCSGGEPGSPSPAPPSLAASRPASGSATPSSAVPSSPTAAPTPTPSPRRSASPASTKDGVYANELSLSEDGALSYLPLRWYAGPDAEARCQEQGIESEGAWCVDYYYEKAGRRKSAALTEGTRVRLLDDNLKPVEAPLIDLVQAIEDEAWPNFQIAVSGGRVTGITQVFTP